jgi:ion channel-forming bestrophin family protein
MLLIDVFIFSPRVLRARHVLQPLLPVCCVSSMFTISAKSRTVVLLVRQRPEQRLEQRRLRASSSSPASSSCSRKSCVESIYHQTRTKTTDTGNKLNCLSLSSSSSSSSSTSCSSLLRSNDKYNNKALKKKRTTSTSPSSPSSSSSFSSRNNRNKNVLIRAKVEPTSDQDDEDDGKNFAGAGFLEGWKGEFSLKNRLSKTVGGNYFYGIRERLLQVDPGLNQTLISSGTSISQLFDQDKWEKHRRVNRFFIDLQNIPTSTVFLRLIRVLFTLTFWAYLVLVMPKVLYSLAHFFAPLLAKAPNVFFLEPTRHALLTWMKSSTIETFTFYISPLFHTMLGTVIGLVLVFRTNSSYARFVEGRVAWGGLVRRCRDFARFALYIENKQLRDKMLGIVACYPFLLKSRLRSGRKREDKNDPSAFKDTPDEAVARVLATHNASGEYAILMNDTRNRPFFCTMRLTHYMKIAVEEGINANAQLMLEQTISEINQCGGTCERLIATPIPLSFSRHSSRSIMIWLLTLPFALTSVSIGWTSLPLMFCVSYLILGVDEIGIQIEEPFATLPLTPLCKVIERDLQAVIDCADYVSSSD